MRISPPSRWCGPPTRNVSVRGQTCAKIGNLLYASTPGTKQRLIDAYNRLDAWSKEWAPGKPEHEQRLSALAQKVPRITASLSFLKSVAGIRNLCIHEQEEHHPQLPEALVLKYEGIVEEIVSGICTLGDVFRNPNIHIWHVEANLIEVETNMRDLRISQIVVRKPSSTAGRQGRLALLTNRGMTLWITDQIQKHNGTVDFSKGTIAAALLYEKSSNWAFMGPGNTIEEARRVMKHFSQDPDRRVWAILITDNGRSDGQLIGILTHFDLAILD